MKERKHAGSLHMGLTEEGVNEEEVIDMEVEEARDDDRGFVVELQRYSHRLHV